MDETEHQALRHLPADALSLRLARPTIRMRHGPRWRIDKVNPVHDLVICLTGSGVYRVGEDPQPVHLRPGDAMLIPAYTRFQGHHGGGEGDYTGIAQHFTLDLFNRGDAVAKMALRRVVALPEPDLLAPLTQHYRETVPHGTTTLVQHHQFMLVLLGYLEAAFQGWETSDDPAGAQDQLSVQIMMAAARLAADPLGSGVETALEGVPYNPEYFRRAFKDRLGLTPQKFRERKRMEFAASRLGQGLSVKAVAGELGYADPYYFSRMFKRFLGASPSTYREARPPT